MKRGKGREKNSLVSELLDVEKTTLSSDVDVSKVLDSVDDGGSNGSSYTVVVRLPDSSNGGDVGFEEVVLSEVCENERKWEREEEVELVDEEDDVL